MSGCGCGSTPCRRSPRSRRRFGNRLGTEEYWLDLGQSLIRILTGFALAAVVGVITGILLGRSALFADVFGPLTELARPIPAIAIVPVAILLFPTDEAGIVFITFLAAYFPIMVSTRHAVRALPTIWEDSVRTLGGNTWDVLRRVVLPGILPGLFGGLSVGIGVAWICVVSAEMISGRLGVGYRTWQAYTVLAYPDVFVGIITIGVLGFATAAAVELIGRRATRWLPRGEEKSDDHSAGIGMRLALDDVRLLVYRGPRGRRAESHGAAGGDPGAHRAVRLRQVDGAARAGRTAAARRRPGASPTGSRSPRPRATAGWCSRTARYCLGAQCDPISNWRCKLRGETARGAARAGPSAGSTKSA